MPKFPTELSCGSQGLMLEVPSAVEFVVGGLKSNLFGLACPFYCTPPSLGSLLSSFLIGLLCGVGLCAWVLTRFDLFPALPLRQSAPSAPVHLAPPTSGRSPSVLLEYLHEQQPRRRR